MSKLSDQVLAMSYKEIEIADWKIVYHNFNLLKDKYEEVTNSRQSWIDPPLSIAKQYANQEV